MALLCGIVQPSWALIDKSEFSKKDAIKGKDSDSNPRKEYSKVCVEHKEHMNILSKDTSEIFAAVNFDVKSGASIQGDSSCKKKKKVNEKANANNTETSTSDTPFI